MARRRDKRASKKTNLNIQFLVEGETERYFIPELLKDNEYKLKINITNVRGGGYYNFIKNIQKNASVYDVIIVIADLDKGADSEGELARLHQLINLVEKENNKNNIFLTYKNIETFIKSCLPNIGNRDLTNYLGYKKGQTDIYERLKSKGFNYKASKLKEADLYYSKKTFSKGTLINNNLRKKQSNLIYFLDYLDELTKGEN